MSNDVRTTALRLMRWYPQSWRAENATVFIDTLELRATHDGRVKLLAGEAWSIRAHGLAARATPAVLSLAAAIALLISAAPVIAVWFAISAGPWVTVPLTMAPYVAALVLSLAAGGLIVRRGALEPEPAALAAVASAVAWVLATLAAVSWSVGFDEADAGGVHSWFGEAFVALAIAAWALGALSVCIVAAAMLRKPAVMLPRVALAAVVAVPVAPVIGASAALPGGTVILCSVVLVLVAVTTGSRKLSSAGREPQTTARGLRTTARRGLALTAAGIGLIGLGCAAFALGGSVLFPATGNSNGAMQLGILAGSLATIAAIVVGAIVARSRYGNAILWPALSIIASVGLVSLSYAIGVNGPSALPLLLSSAILAGVAGGLLFRPLLPRGRAVRIGLVAAISISLAASFGLLFAVTLAGFGSPILAVVILVLLRRPHADLKHQRGKVFTAAEGV